MSSKILIVDDEELIRWSLSEDLSSSGYRTLTAEDVASAKALIEKESPDLVLTDLRLGPGSGTGLDVLKAARQADPGLPVILMTAFADLSSAVEALREGAADYISKPLQLAGLKITLQRVLETASLRSRLQQAQRKRQERYRFDTVVCASPSMQEAVGLARKIAASPLGTVLILGESGCGKDLLARSIHFESPRAAEPLMEISCTAIPENLLESELFGYEKGAFTGAAQQKKGLFELADGGTVFLNEIGHMPPGLQAKILRVLEDKTFKRVGGREDITVDVRIIAATNENLEAAVAAGTFRSDLYYRINVLTIRLLPLRERREDIAPLIDRLLDKLCRDLRKPKPRLPEQTLAEMQGYAWPGNVRELRNVLERMMILEDTRFAPAAPPAPAAAASGFSLPQDGVKVEDVERSLVAQALERCGGNQQKAAQLLGLSRDALRRRMEKFGLKVLAAALLVALAGPAQAGLFGGKPKSSKADDAFISANADKAQSFKGKEGAHSPAKEGACAKCHADPKDPKKLVLDYKALCFSCHKDREEDLKKASVHSPYRDMDCSTCHVPHVSDQPHLLSADPKELCAQCHAAADEPMRKAHHGIAEFSGLCTGCHSPHASANAKLLWEGSQHVPFKSRSCEMCHEAAGKDGKAKLKEMPEKSCFVCHSDFRKLGESPVVHAPFQGGGCGDCHNPHLSPRPSLMKGKTADICLSCHDASLKDAHPVARHPTSRAGKSDPRRKDKPFDCASCHDPHAGKLPKLTRDDPMVLCEECHQK
ncbi:MAG: sigma 54-interacting transcriptional regulator [Elusimicrobia bacterium]|nr:sigma 54-interacting transcriptional regulator [Elusimicrobiota bacterium]